MRAVHLKYLDGWRGMAIALLLLGHFFPIPGINFGAVGVNLFFVLSGLLMARLLFVREVPLREFYKRRIARIFPAALVFLALVTGWHLATGRPVSWTELFTALTFINNYFAQGPELTLMPFGHIWSLCVEEHSYILLSLIALLARRKIGGARALVLGAALVMVGFGIYYVRVFDGRELSFHLLHSEFAAFGIFISALLVLLFRSKKPPPLPSIVFLGVFMLALAMHWWSVPALPRAIGGVAVFALAINMLGDGPLLVQKVLGSFPLRQLGLWSYSIYLWQQPFYLALHRGELSAPLAIGAALLCGIVSFYVVERPARGYLNRRWAGPPAAAAAVQVPV